MKQFAPNQLYLGCRFAVVGFNIYNRSLDPNTLGFTSTLGKPCMIGEFHFGALDSRKRRWCSMRRSTGHRGVSALEQAGELSLRGQGVGGCQHANGQGMLFRGATAPACPGQFIFHKISQAPRIVPFQLRCWRSRLSDQTLKGRDAGKVRLMIEL
jgi:hypothetical protein